MIGTKIRDLRKERGLTQATLSQDPAITVSQASIAAYETGAREPNIETITQLAQYFNVTTDYLLGMSEHKRPQADDDELASLLSDGSLEFLRGCDPDLLKTVDSVLASGRAVSFFEELRSYVLALDAGDGDLLDRVFPLVDHLSRDPDAELKAVQFFRSYKRDLVSKELDELCGELRAEQLTEKQARGRPKKGKKKNGPKAAEGGDEIE